MDKISKALKKLSLREGEIVKGVLLKLKNGLWQGLEIKKLKGYDNIFRVRKGRVRILYKINKDRSVDVLTIERRSDRTYKF